jgi:large subunit ribosomal protein L36e
LLLPLLLLLWCCRWQWFTLHLAGRDAAASGELLPAQRNHSSRSSSSSTGQCMATCCSMTATDRLPLPQHRNGQDKKARKMAKNRLGTLKRGKRKVDHLTNVIAEQRRTGAH